MDINPGLCLTYTSKLRNMHLKLITSLLTLFLCTPNLKATANEKFTGTFEGTGRACAGKLFVRTKTIEWNSTYSICNKTHYEIIEKNLTADQKHIAFRLKNKNKLCRYEVIELEYLSDYNWNVNGYQTTEGFKNRLSKEWIESSLPERQILSCLMIDLR
jgi:hypothetical protein